MEKKENNPENEHDSDFLQNQIHFFILTLEKY